MRVTHQLGDIPKFLAFVLFILLLSPAVASDMCPPSTASCFDDTYYAVVKIKQNGALDSSSGYNANNGDSGYGFCLVHQVTIYNDGRVDDNNDGILDDPSVYVRFKPPSEAFAGWVPLTTDVGRVTSGSSDPNSKINLTFSGQLNDSEFKIPVIPSEFKIIGVEETSWFENSRRLAGGKSSTSFDLSRTFTFVRGCDWVSYSGRKCKDTLVDIDSNLGEDDDDIEKANLDMYGYGDCVHYVVDSGKSGALIVALLNKSLFGAVYGLSYYTVVGQSLHDYSMVTRSSLMPDFYQNPTIDEVCCNYTLPSFDISQPMSDTACVPKVQCDANKKICPAGSTSCQPVQYLKCPSIAGGFCGYPSSSGSTDIPSSKISNTILSFNWRAGPRVLGCDYCNYQDQEACSLGHSTAKLMKEQNWGTPPFYPEWSCGYYGNPPRKVNSCDCAVGRSKDTDSTCEMQECAKCGEWGYGCEWDGEACINCHYTLGPTGQPEFPMIQDSARSIKTNLTFLFVNASGKQFTIAGRNFTRMYSAVGHNTQGYDDVDNDLPGERYFCTNPAGSGGMACTFFDAKVPWGRETDAAGGNWNDVNRAYPKGGVAYEYWFGRGTYDYSDYIQNQPHPELCSDYVIGGSDKEHPPIYDPDWFSKCRFNVGAGAGSPQWNCDCTRPEHDPKNHTPCYCPKTLFPLYTDGTLFNLPNNAGCLNEKCFFYGKTPSGSGVRVCDCPGSKGKCGDDICYQNGGEDPAQCPEDCCPSGNINNCGLTEPCNGDGKCDPNEHYTWCPKDCWHSDCTTGSNNFEECKNKDKEDADKWMRCTDDLYGDPSFNRCMCGDGICWPAAGETYRTCGPRKPGFNTDCVMTPCPTGMTCKVNPSSGKGVCEYDIFDCDRPKSFCGDGVCWGAWQPDYRQGYDTSSEHYFYPSCANSGYGQLDANGRVDASHDCGLPPGTSGDGICEGWRGETYGSSDCGPHDVCKNDGKCSTRWGENRDTCPNDCPATDSDACQGDGSADYLGTCYPACTAPDSAAACDAVCNADSVNHVLPDACKNGAAYGHPNNEMECAPIWGDPDGDGVNDVVGWSCTCLSSRACGKKEAAVADGGGCDYDCKTQKGCDSDTRCETKQGETSGNCAGDCVDVTCNDDGICQWWYNENPYTCTKDVSPPTLDCKIPDTTCGDGVCWNTNVAQFPALSGFASTANEDNTTCPQDCPMPPGLKCSTQGPDGVCWPYPPANENKDNCPEDCSPQVACEANKPCWPPEKTWKNCFTCPFPPGEAGDEVCAWWTGFNDPFADEATDMCGPPTADGENVSCTGDPKACCRCPTQMPDITYYRLFTIDSIWSHVFKVTPEVDNVSMDVCTDQQTCQNNADYTFDSLRYSVGYSLTPDTVDRVDACHKYAAKEVCGGCYAANITYEANPEVCCQDSGGLFASCKPAADCDTIVLPYTYCGSVLGSDCCGMPCEHKTLKELGYSGYPTKVDCLPCKNATGNISKCGDYTNMEACEDDPCGISTGRAGCYWPREYNETSTCYDCPLNPKPSDCKTLYASQRACEKDPCKISSCGWNPTDTGMGRCYSYSEGVYNCNDLCSSSKPCDRSQCDSASRLSRDGCGWADPAGNGSVNCYPCIVDRLGGGSGDTVSDCGQYADRDACLEDNCGMGCYVDEGSDGFGGEWWCGSCDDLQSAGLECDGYEIMEDCIDNACNFPGNCFWDSEKDSTNNYNGTCRGCQTIRSCSDYRSQDVEPSYLFGSGTPLFGSYLKGLQCEKDPCRVGPCAYIDKNSGWGVEFSCMSVSGASVGSAGKSGENESSENTTKSFEPSCYWVSGSSWDVQNVFYQECLWASYAVPGGCYWHAPNLFGFGGCHCCNGYDKGWGDGWGDEDAPAIGACNSYPEKVSCEGDMCAVGPCFWDDYYNLCRQVLYVSGMDSMDTRGTYFIPAGNAGEEDNIGQSPVWAHAGAGANVPNLSKAEGFDSTYPETRTPKMSYQTLHRNGSIWSEVKELDTLKYVKSPDYQRSKPNDFDPYIAACEKNGILARYSDWVGWPKNATDSQTTAGQYNIRKPIPVGNFTNGGKNGVEAAPDACGSLCGKFVVQWPELGIDRNNLLNARNTWAPYNSQFNYWLNETDKNGNNKTTLSGSMIRKMDLQMAGDDYNGDFNMEYSNIMPRSAGPGGHPYTMFNWFNFPNSKLTGHWLDETTYQIRVGSNYTVNMSLLREPMALQCLWDSCLPYYRRDTNGDGNGDQNVLFDRFCGGNGCHIAQTGSMTVDNGDGTTSVVPTYSCVWNCDDSTICNAGTLTGWSDAVGDQDYMWSGSNWELDGKYDDLEYHNVWHKCAEVDTFAGVTDTTGLKCGCKTDQGQEYYQHRCVACWMYEDCDYPIISPKEAPNPSSGKLEGGTEYVNDSSFVLGNVYPEDPERLVTERPLENEDPIVNFTIFGYIDRKTLTYTPKFQENATEKTIQLPGLGGRICIKVEPDPDFINGFKILIPDRSMLIAYVNEYPASHELIRLDTTSYADYCKEGGDKVSEITSITGDQAVMDVNYYGYRCDQTVEYKLLAIDNISQSTEGISEHTKKGMKNLGMTWWLISSDKYYQQFNNPKYLRLYMIDRYAASTTPYNRNVPASGTGWFFSASPLPAVRNYQEDQKRYYDFAGFGKYPLNLHAKSYTQIFRLPVEAPNLVLVPLNSMYDINGSFEYYPRSGIYQIDFNSNNVEYAKGDSLQLVAYTPFRNINLDITPGVNDNLPPGNNIAKKNIFERPQVRMDAKMLDASTCSGDGPEYYNAYDPVCFKVTLTGGGGVIDTAAAEMEMSAGPPPYNNIPEINKVIHSDETVKFNLKRDGPTIFVKYGGVPKSCEGLYEEMYGTGGSPSPAAPAESAPSLAGASAAASCSPAGPPNYCAVGGGQVIISPSVPLKGGISWMSKNILIIIVTFFALMSYRFFRDKRMDFASMFKESGLEETINDLIGKKR